MFVEHKEKGETPAKLDESSMLLMRAAALVEKFGLAKFIQEDSDGSLCAVGAIIKAAGGMPYSHRYSDGREHGLGTVGEAGKIAVARMEDALRPIAKCDWDPVASWNNREERTQAEVVSKLRAVALWL